MEGVVIDKGRLVWHGRFVDCVVDMDAFIGML